MLLNSFLDELEKISGALAKRVRAASPSDAKEMIERAYRSVGVPPPSGWKVSDYGDPKNIDLFLKNLRELRKQTVPEVAPRGSRLWRSAMRDIRSGNMTPVESGLNAQQGKNILQEGPSNRALNLPLVDNMPLVREALDKELKRITRADRADIRAIEKRYGRDSAQADAAWDAADRKRDLLNKKLSSGIYASDSGTLRTKQYASRAGGEKETPAVLRFDLPASLARSKSGKEFRIPHSVYSKWARNPRVETLEGKLLHRKTRIPSKKTGSN